MRARSPRPAYVLAAALALALHGAAFSLARPAPPGLELKRTRPQSLSIEFSREEPALTQPAAPATAPAPAPTPAPAAQRQSQTKKPAPAAPAPKPAPEQTPGAPPPNAGPDAAALIPPSPLQSAHNPPPEYPALARKRGQQGTVLVMAQVDAQGRVQSAALAQSSGHRLLDEAALKAVRSWRFSPARRGGAPVPERAFIPVEFLLTAPAQ